ncbi:dTDP-4-dehydrorhamnose reductase [Micromonospora sp. CPCC 205561]|uniref:dTDP-4-dehydrorhamnose reductase n=1 Tax=Micromonospora sp. CPCC 205561 TaxID=3122407 RepID=UPI002FF0522D
MTRWLVTGAGGMLGRDIVEVLRTRPGAVVTAAGHGELDITDAAAVARAVPGHDIVVNAAAWTDVDGAEAAEDLATAVNGHAVGHLAGACADNGVHLVHISTDYVLTGDGDAPLDEAAPPAPVNAYGRSKLAGERAVRAVLPHTGHVVRTAWLYGEHGPNFVATMLLLAASRPDVRVVADQHGQPTWSAALAEGIVDLGGAARAGRLAAGIYHGVAGGRTTWYGLARAVYEECGLDPDRVRPTTTDRFPRPARRPAFSVLARRRWAEAGLELMDDWRSQLRAALRRPGLAELAEAARAVKAGAAPPGRGVAPGARSKTPSTAKMAANSGDGPQLG